MTSSQKSEQFVKEIMTGQEPGHDWWHVRRVWKSALYIADHEGDVNREVIELASLLHDIDDWKFGSGKTQKARSWLESLSLEEHDIEHICAIIDQLSFKGAKVATPMQTKEGMIVQDADRLDAIGAIGIARAFSYGGCTMQEMYNPYLTPIQHETFDQYKNARTTTVNHFYEKLLLLKDQMNTKTASNVAQERHRFMEVYLQQFFTEWEPK